MTLSRPATTPRPIRRSATARTIAVAIACTALVGCQTLPSPGPASPPLTKARADALTKCQQSINKATATFAKLKLPTLQKCLDGVLKVRVPFENGVLVQAEYDAGIAKMQEACTKAYGKVTAGSTKLVDAVIKACAPVEDLVLGAYDGLRVQAGFSVGGGPGSDLEQLAGTLCTVTEALVDAQLGLATPRMMELLGYLGPDFVVELDMDSSGLPNVPLDPRCPPIDVLGSVPTPF